MIAAVAFLMGGWYYVGNLMQHGNPFYPFEVNAAGLHLPGSITRNGEMRMLNAEFTPLAPPVRLWRLWREEKSHFGLWLYNADRCV